jgi:hypothetical protein
MHGAYNVKLFI